MATYSFTFRSSLGEVSISTLPKNWQDLKFNLARSKTYMGLGRKIAATFEFVKDARKYIRDLYYAEGIDAYLEIDIWIHNDSKWRSKELFQTYKGDFSEVRIDDVVASIKMVDSSFEEKINSRGSTKVNLNTLTSIDGDTIPGERYPMKTALLHDRTLLLKNKHVPANKLMKPGYYFKGALDIGVDTRHWPIDLDVVYTSNPNIGSVFSSDFIKVEDLPKTKYIVEQLFLLNSDKDISLLINAHLYIHIVNPVNEHAQLFLNIYSVDEDRERIDLLHEVEVYDGSLETELDTEIVISDLRLDILEGQSLVIEFYCPLNFLQPARLNPLEVTFRQNEDSYILSENVDIVKKSPTRCEVMLPHETAERILQIITGESNPFFSPVFGRTDIGYDVDGMWAYLVQTNGYFVRQFPQTYTDDEGNVKEITINTSFKDWFKSYSSILNLGAYIEKKDGYSRMVVDYLYNIFDSSVVGLVIDNYSDLVVTPIKDEYFGSIAFGYEDIQHENVTGLDSFNGEMNHSTPITNVSDRMDKICPYVTDDYAAAFAQRKPYSNFPKEDTRYDDMNMLLDGYKSGDYILIKRDEEFTKVEGILAPDKAYNLNLSPKRNLLRHANNIATGLYRKPDKYLKFTKGARNPNLVTRKTGESADVIENEDILITNLGTPLFLPNFISFKSKITWQQFKYLNENPNALIEMIIDDVLVYGFIDTLDYSITNGEADFVLIQSNR